MLTRLRIIGCIFWLTMVGCMVYAEDAGGHSTLLKIKYGFNVQTDEYLSPLRYTGQEIGLGAEWEAQLPLPKQNTTSTTNNWQWIAKADINGAKAYTKKKTNYIYAVDIQGGWGAMYHFNQGVLVANQLDIYVGPYMDLSAMVKMHTTEINKPVSTELGIDADAMVGASWTYRAPKTAYRINYRLRTNIIGIDWAPDYWQSYYEVTEGIIGNVRCSGPWNRNVLRHELSLDLQFLRSTWRIGAEHEWLNYRTAEMAWNRQEVRIVIGCIWHNTIQGKAIK